MDLIANYDICHERTPGSRVYVQMFQGQVIPFKFSNWPSNWPLFPRRARVRCFVWIAITVAATVIAYHIHCHAWSQDLPLATLPALTRPHMDHIRLQEDVNELMNYGYTREEWANPESPPKVTGLPTSPYIEQRGRPRLNTMPNDLADRSFCPTPEGYQRPCKVILPIWVANGEGTGVRSLLQLAQLAKELGRILVLPNIDIARGRLGTCSSEPIQRYYSVPGVASSHGTPRTFDDFLLWTSLRESPPTTHTLTVHHKPRSDGLVTSPMHRHCLESKAPHLFVTNSTSTVHPPKRNRHASPSFVGFDSHLLKHAQALSADVLLVTWHLTNPIFRGFDDTHTPVLLRPKVYQVVNTMMQIFNISRFVLWEYLPQSSGDLAKCIDAMLWTAQNSTWDLVNQEILFLSTPFSTRTPLDGRENRLRSIVQALAPSQFTIIDISDALLAITGRPGSQRNFSSWMDLSEFTTRGVFTGNFIAAVELVLASRIQIVLIPEGSCDSTK
jgi:hypothetical protein